LLQDLHYTLFIDESGDQDLSRFRTDDRPHGSDPFLVFGGALVPTMFAQLFREKLDEYCRILEVEALHCTDLSHRKRAFFARSVKELRVQFFGVVSKKATVRDYAAKIEGEKQRQDYYNKCAVYLLERVGHFMSVNKYNSDQLSIVFEEKRHDYQRLRNFLSAIKRTPLDNRAAYLQRIDPLSITAEAKKDEKLLALADLVAFSLYQSVTETKTNYLMPEQRYLREIKSKFWADPATGKIAGYGIKFIKGPYEMKLTGETLQMALKFYNKTT